MMCTWCMHVRMTSLPNSHQAAIQIFFILKKSLNYVLNPQPHPNKRICLEAVIFPFQISIDSLSVGFFTSNESNQKSLPFQ